MSREAAGTRLNEGMKLQDAGDLAGALAAYRDAAAIDPSYPSPHFNAGLVHKWRSEWQPSIEAFEHYLAMVPDARDRSAALWNIGIAASALSDWRRARASWSGLGMPIEPGDTPPELYCGPTPIRLLFDDGDHGEVVWTDRIDPCRARIYVVPTPESGHRFGDLVLHDAEPRGSRELDGERVSVFNALALLEPSSYQTFAARLVVPTDDDESALYRLFIGDHDLGATDWSSLSILHAACSEGDVPAAAERRHSAAPDSERTFGLAAPTRAIADALLAEWSAAASARRVVSVEQVTPPR